MNSTDMRTIRKESDRLDSLGIPFDHIHLSEGKPVVTVQTDILESIISRRDQGEPIKGLFIACNDRYVWSASMTDSTGKHHHRTGLTECKAYRYVLGYPIGHYTRRSRYVGQPEYKNRRKQRRKVHSFKF